MFQIIFRLRNPLNLQISSQVRSILSIKHSICSTPAVADSPLPSSKDHITETQRYSSSIRFSGIAKSVLVRFPDVIGTKKHESYTAATLKDLLLGISDIIPETARKFLRLGGLNPENVLEILLGFQSECEKVGFRAEKVEILWEIYRRVKMQKKGFEHLNRSKEVMASMLIRVKMLAEAELLLSEIERDGVMLNYAESFCNLIEGYVGIGDLENAVMVFDKMLGPSLVPSLSCYQTLIDFSVKMKKTHLAYRVCIEMLEMGINFRDSESTIFEDVIQLLCREGMIQEARNLCVKLMALGLKPSGLVLNEIARGYCEKRDFEDLLSFFVKMNHAPDVSAVNRIVNSLCIVFGVERANLFIREFEHLGFNPDEVTLGILINWSCHQGNLRGAFGFLSEILSRGLNPDVRSFNAIIGGLFKNGLWNHTRDIYDEMVSMGINPTLDTCRLLLAGYCRDRRFDEAKALVFEMVNRGFIEIPLQEDSLSKAFTLLGFDPSAVRLRRDNGIGFSKTEFFDNLGNGLYLDTDLDEYNKRLTRIIDDSLVPNFNSLVLLQCDLRNLKAALLLADEMVQWGQEMSFYVFSTLVKALSVSRSLIRAVFGLFEKFPKLANQLDQESLNLLVQACCKSRMVDNGKILLDGMIWRGLPIKNETYTAVFSGLCRKGISKDLHNLWDIAQNKEWLPKLEDTKALLECLCHHKMMKPTLELFESMLVFHPSLTSQICNTFMEKLCFMGFSSVANVLVDELQQKGLHLDKLAYNYVITGFCKEKKFHNAFKLFDSMLAEQTVPSWDVFVLLTPQLIRSNKFENALARMKEFCLEDESVVLLSFSTALIKGFCLTGKMDEATEIFRQMLSKGLISEDEVFNMLVQGYCEANDVRKFNELLGFMIRTNLSLSVSSFRNLVHRMCKDKVHSAISLKEIMLGECKCHNLVIYNILIFSLLSSGNNILANEVFSELPGKGLDPNEVTYSFLIYGLLKCNDVLSSWSYLSTMISKGFTPSKRSLRKVMSRLCDVGEFEKAVELSREMESKGWVHDSVVQNAIAEGLLSRGKLLEAEHFLDTMVDKSLVPDDVIYDNLIKQFCGYGRLNKAVDLLNIMLKKGNVPDPTSYDYLIHGFYTRKNLNRAMDFHIEMLVRNLKPAVETWDILIRGFCQEGKAEEAERILISMVGLGETPTREMFMCVINRYCFENNSKKSSELMQMMQQSGYSPDFDTHWSLISNLRHSNNKDDNNKSSSGSSQGFLSKLLSGSGFFSRNEPNRK